MNTNKTKRPLRLVFLQGWDVMVQYNVRVSHELRAWGEMVVPVS